MTYAGAEPAGATVTDVQLVSGAQGGTMKIETALKDMKREELEGMLISIHEALWDPAVYYKHVEWTPDTLDAIAEVFQMEELHPYNLEEYQDE